MVNQNIKELPFGLFIDSSWASILEDVLEGEQFKKLGQFVADAYQSSLVFPRKENVFKAFSFCSLDQVKVVILGQDPYHGLGQADGLSFSVPTGVPIPPSLHAIFKEIKTDLNIEVPKDGDLSRWANQGVFLLNSTLTVKGNQAGSHQKKGWEDFSDAVIQVLDASRHPLVFLLWGAHAIKKAKLIHDPKHLILSAPHPSPLSSYRGFFGCKHFSKANQFLIENGLEPIKW